MRLMIVDDEQIILSSLAHQSIWAKLGFDEVVTSNSTEDAKRKLALCRPDYLMTDLMMPEEDGFELIRYCISVFPATDIIVVSGYSEFEFAQKAMNLGARGYILKPTDEYEIEEVFSRLIRDKENIAETELGGDALNAVKEFINMHYSEKINLQMCADIMNMSYSHFSVYFKQLSGVGLNDYINNVRIKKAKILLEETNYSISEIAYKTGFSDQAYFNRIFQKREGMSPKCYQQQSRKKGTKK